MAFTQEIGIDITGIDENAAGLQISYLRHGMEDEFVRGCFADHYAAFCASREQKDAIDVDVSPLHLLFLVPDTERWWRSQLALLNEYGRHLRSSSDYKGFRRQT